MAMPSIAKRPAPGQPAGGPPTAKARIAKSGAAAPATAKAPVAKAPVAKAPVAKAPAQPLPKAADSGEAAEGAGGKLGRSDSWRDFANVDPLYALLGEVSQHKVVSPDGTLQRELLLKYLDMLIIQKAAKKPKDWIEVWAAMDIPVPSQTLVLEPILTYGLEYAPESLGKILGELLKGHRIKTKALEDAVAVSFKGMSDKGVLRETFFMIFPKGPQSEWGWSRVGWSWQEWWKIVEGCYVALDPAKAFDEVAALLDRIEAAGGKPLAEQPMIWSAMRLGKARTLLCKLGNVEDEKDLVACLDATIR